MVSQRFSNASFIFSPVGSEYEKEFLAEFETLSVDKKNQVLATSKVAQQVLATSSKIN